MTSRGKKTLTLVALLAAVFAGQFLVDTPSTVGDPYGSALTAVAYAAPSGCENKHCFICSTCNQSKCVDNAGTNCVIESVHGRGHGRICQTLAC